MKYVGAILLAVLGYAAFDPAARTVFMSQSTGWMVFEYICLHITVAAFVGMEFYSRMTANLTLRQDDDGGYWAGGCALGLLWPVTMPFYYFGRYVFLPIVKGLFNGMGAWVTKRKERF